MMYNRAAITVFGVLYSLCGICAEVTLEDTTKIWPIRAGREFEISLVSGTQVKSAGISVTGPGVCSVTLGSIEMKFHLPDGSWAQARRVGSPGKKIRHGEQWSSTETRISGSGIVSDRVAVKFLDQKSIMTCPHWMGARDDASWRSTFHPYIKDEKLNNLDMPYSFWTYGTDVVEGPSVRARVKDTVDIVTLTGSEQLVTEGVENVQISGNSIVGETVTLTSSNADQKVKIHYDRQTGTLSWDLSRAMVGVYHGTLIARVTAL